jgi:hypothetical protein
MVSFRVVEDRGGRPIDTRPRRWAAPLARTVLSETNKRGHAWPRRGRLADQSCGSTSTIEARWLLPTRDRSGCVVHENVPDIGILGQRIFDALTGLEIRS